MPSPSIRLSADGVTYGAPGVKMAFSEGTTVHAKLDSIQGVSVCTWAIIFADGVNSTPASYTIVPDTGAVVGDKVKFNLPAATEGVSVILQSTINDGVGPDGNTDLTATQATIKAYVLAPNGLEVPAVGETYEGDPVYGTGPQVTAAILAAGVAGGGVTTSRQINTSAPLTGGGDLTANRTLGISAATDSTEGSMSAADKTKLDAATATAAASTLAIRDGDGGDAFAYVDVPAGAAPAAPGGTAWRVFADSGDGNRLKAVDQSGNVTLLSRTMIVSNTKTLNASNTTAEVGIFQIFGNVRIVKLYALVTTQLGADHTADQFMWSDGGSPQAIAPACVTNLSIAPPGSMIAVSSLSGSLETLGFAVGADAQLEIAANERIFQDFLLAAHVVGTTYILHQYITTDTPTVGAMLYVCEYEPLGGGSVVAV